MILGCDCESVGLCVVRLDLPFDPPEHMPIRARKISLETPLGRFIKCQKILSPVICLPTPSARVRVGMDDRRSPQCGSRKAF